jgi:hypothetical protein
VTVLSYIMEEKIAITASNHHEKEKKKQTPNKE